MLSSSAPSSPPVSDVASTGEISYPDWVILDAVNLIGRKTPAMPSSASAAAKVSVKSNRRAGLEEDVEVFVSFFLASPPEVSRYTVQCRRSEAPRDEHHCRAVVVSSEGDMVLFYMVFHIYMPGLYFVFSAAAAGHGNNNNNPALEVLPCHSYNAFHPTRPVGILPHPDGDGSYVVASISPVVNTRARGVSEYELFRYSSKAKAWSRTIARVDSQISRNDLNDILKHQTSKVIAMGGDSLGWVDLWWGILVCNVLDEDDLVNPPWSIPRGGSCQSPVVRFIELPDPMPGNESRFGTLPARQSCDVICIGGFLRFIEVDYAGNSSHHGVDDYCWKATAWKKPASSTNFADWEECFTVDTDELIVTYSTRHSCMVSELRDDKLQAGNLSLERIICSCPTLTMEDDVFYMNSPGHPLTWLGAVNMGGKFPAAVSFKNMGGKTAVSFKNMGRKPPQFVYFTSESAHCEPTYRVCAFSKYLKITSGD